MSERLGIAFQFLLQPIKSHATHAQCWIGRAHPDEAMDRDECDAMWVILQPCLKCGFYRVEIEKPLLAEPEQVGLEDRLLVAAVDFKGAAFSRPVILASVCTLINMAA
jgi:hypothetical protein